MNKALELSAQELGIVRAALRIATAHASHRILLGQMQALQDKLESGRRSPTIKSPRMKPAAAGGAR